MPLVNTLAHEEVENKVLAADPLEIEAILRNHTNEWSLWGALVFKFNQESYHMAYLSYCARTGQLAKASERYLRHQKVFLPLQREAWQVDQCEKMLNLSQTLLLLQLEREQNFASQKIWDFGPYKSQWAYYFGIVMLWAIIFIYFAQVKGH